MQVLRRCAVLENARFTPPPGGVGYMPGCRGRHKSPKIFAQMKRPSISYRDVHPAVPAEARGGELCRLHLLQGVKPCRTSGGGRKSRCLDVAAFISFKGDVFRKGRGRPGYGRLHPGRSNCRSKAAWKRVFAVFFVSWHNISAEGVMRRLRACRRGVAALKRNLEAWPPSRAYTYACAYTCVCACVRL